MHKREANVLLPDEKVVSSDTPRHPEVGASQQVPFEIPGPLAFTFNHSCNVYTGKQLLPAAAPCTIYSEQL